MPNLFVSEDFVDATNNCRYSNSEVYESRFDKASDLYRFCIKEWGRCISKIYVEGPTKHVGWVFVKRVPYDDNPRKTYLREVWVTVYMAPPVKTINFQYAELK